MNINSIKGIDAEFSEIILATLPQRGKDFVEIIGLEPTLALVSTFGGAEVRFIKNSASWRFERIADVVGRDAAIKLAGEFSHEPIYIPQCSNTRKTLRNRQIVIEFDELISKKEMSGRDAVNDLAIKHGLCYRQVEKIVNGKA